MKKYESNTNVEQLGFLTVMEEGKGMAAKRVDIVSLRDILVTRTTMARCEDYLVDGEECCEI